LSKEINEFKGCLGWN